MDSAPSSSSLSKISPILILLIVMLAVIFFLAGLLHLIRFFLRRRSSSSPIYQSNRFLDTSGSLQRQLQQLFRLHDSGLDQASIDTLPVFFYKDIIGLKDPFDCAVCLCEFSDGHKLRLLPLCSHAFHIHCIDTWLLSNSTCPLCRSTLISSSGLPLENSLFGFESVESSNQMPNVGETGVSCHLKSGIMEEVVDPQKVFPVRLGKFKSVNENIVEENLERGEGESSSCNLDARRCFSLGSFQYVVGDLNLKVSFSTEKGKCSDVKLGKERGHAGNSSGNFDSEGKKISSRIRGDSFSVSKVWLWSKRNKLVSSDSHTGFLFSINGSSRLESVAQNV